MFENKNKNICALHLFRPKTTTTTTITKTSLFFVLFKYFFFWILPSMLIYFSIVWISAKFFLCVYIAECERLIDCCSECKQRRNCNTKKYLFAFQFKITNVNEWNTSTIRLVTSHNGDATKFRYYIFVFLCHSRCLISLLSPISWLPLVLQCVTLNECNNMTKFNGFRYHKFHAEIASLKIIYHSWEMMIVFTFIVKIWPEAQWAQLTVYRSDLLH